jgi:predicted phosphoribosyltransferase
MLFESREHAAYLLAQRLSAYYKNKNPLVLAVPRGAVPMAKIIADFLGGELDVTLVRKLGHPSQPELAVGAVDESGTVFLSDYAFGIDAAYLEEEKTGQLEVLRRRRAQYTPARSPIDPHDRIVIVVDDGVATGSTMIAALRAVHGKRPDKLVAAVAVASVQAARAIADEADAIVCLSVPDEFYAVGQFFREFPQVSDEEVITILRQNKTKISTAGNSSDKGEL